MRVKTSPGCSQEKSGALLGGDYGTHSGIIGPPLGTLISFSWPNI